MRSGVRRPLLDDEVLFKAARNNAETLHFRVVETLAGELARAVKVRMWTDAERLKEIV